MKIKILFHLFIVCNFVSTQNMETVTTITPNLTDNCLQKLINHLNNNSSNIVTIIKAHAENKNIPLNPYTIPSFLNINQKQIDTLFLNNIKDDELRPVLLSMGANINAVTESNCNCLWHTKNPTYSKNLLTKALLLIS